MRIVDAQIHVWGQGLPSNQAHWQITSFTPAEAIAMMDEAGVHGAVIHPPSWDPDSHAMALQAVQEYPGRFAVLGHLPLEPFVQGDAQALARVASWRENQPGMLGLRYLFLGDPARTWLVEGALDDLWAACERAGVPVAVLATDTLAEFGGVAERHPGLRLTIDHLGGRGGNTTAKDAAAMEHMPELLKLARLPNVAVKATGAPGYSAEAYPYPIMQDYLRQVFDAFGPTRTFWGTDISKMPCSWRQCVTMFTDELDWLRGDDLEQVMSKAVCAWWGWTD